MKHEGNSPRCTVRKHSHKQIELKLLYPLENEGKDIYRMDCFLFFPPQLRVTEKRMGPREFLNSIQINTRFSSPRIPLEKVIDKDFKMSPLTRLNGLLDRLGAEKRDLEKPLIYELQTLCNLYRAETRTFSDLIRREIKKGLAPAIYRERIGQMFITIESFLEGFRSLHSKFLDPHINETLREALRWADESISICTEKSLLRLHETLEAASEGDLTDKLESLLTGEADYREAMNYEFFYREDNPRIGEIMAYRDSMLKKWSQSAMYMNSEYSRAPYRIGHLIAGTAAGMAMFFAVSAAVLAEKISPQYSSLWILVMVLSYIMKDRIKEVLKAFFGNLMPRLTTDQQINLYDPAMKTKAGRSSGTVSYPGPSRLPGDIFQLRYEQTNPLGKIFPPDTVIHYRKRMQVNGGMLRKNHSRLEALTEVIRFQADSWLKEMDDPKETLFRLEKGKLKKIQGTRVYRIHMIIKLGKELYHKVLIFKRTGLVRIE